MVPVATVAVARKGRLAVDAAVRLVEPVTTRLPLMVRTEPAATSLFWPFRMVSGGSGLRAMTIAPAL